MNYVTLVLSILSVIAGYVAYLSIKKNTILTKEKRELQKSLAEEISLRLKIEEANKAYAQKIITLSKGTDTDKFNSAISIMSNNTVPSSKP